MPRPRTLLDGLVIDRFSPWLWQVFHNGLAARLENWLSFPPSSEEPFVTPQHFIQLLERFLTSCLVYRTLPFELTSTIRSQ
jgi:hypothetical protein